MVSMIRKGVAAFMLASVISLVGCSSEVSAPSSTSSTAPEQVNYDMGSDQLFINVGDNIALPLPIGTLFGSVNIGLDVRPAVLMQTTAFQECVQGLTLTLRSSVAQLQATAQNEIENILADLAVGRLRPAQAIALIQNVRTRLATAIATNPVRTQVASQLQACAASLTQSLTGVLTENQLIRVQNWALNVIVI